MKKRTGENHPKHFLRFEIRKTPYIVNSGRLHLKGIVFSSRRMGKNGKVYSTKKIFQSLQFLNCFFIIFSYLRSIRFCPKSNNRFEYDR